MKYTIDTEFNGFGGELLSLALVPWDEADLALYLRVPAPIAPLDPWVAENVWPLIDACPLEHRLCAMAPVEEWAHRIAAYLTNDGDGRGIPYIIADWPDDIRYFCEAIVTAPGEMAAIPRLQFDVVRVDPYEAGTASDMAVRHNAYWDALVLRDHVKLFSASDCRA